MSVLIFEYELFLSFCSGSVSAMVTATVTGIMDKSESEASPSLEADAAIRASKTYHNEDMSR